MDSPSRLIARTALVCLAAISVAPSSENYWSVSAAAGLQQANEQQSAQAKYPPQAGWSLSGFNWPQFGGGAGVNGVSATASSQPHPPAAAAQGERVRRQTTTRKKQANKNKQFNQDVIAECLAAHNKMRRLHGVPDLEWDDKLATFAEKRSKHIAASDGKEFGHPPDLPFGENLFWHSTLEKGCDYMVKGWYDEIGLYDFKAPTFAPATGHFTQMIWRGTQKVGCAFAKSNGSRGGLYLTCNYDPPGNWVGEFDANVPLPKGPPAITTSPSTPTTTTTTTTTTTSTTVAPVPVQPVQPVQPAQPAQPAAESVSTRDKKKKKKKKGKKKPADKDKKKSNKKKKGNKKKKKTPSTTAAPAITTTSSSATSKAPGLISS